MNDAGTDAASRLWWAVKRYRLIVGLVVVGAGVLGATQGPSLLADSDRPVYEATALVVAAELEVHPDLLPKTAVAIFEAGAVATRTVERTGTDTAPDELIPDVVRVDPVESSVVLEVSARHADAEAASELANTAAEAFVDELNRPGELFGHFIVQESAQPPASAEPQPGPALPTVVAIMAGLTFALGLIGLYVALRRPVLSPVETSELTGAPVLGAPNLPRGASLDPTRVAGLTALLTRIFPTRRETAVVVGVRGDRGQRTAVALLLARGLARTGPVHLVSEDDLPADLSGDERRNLHLATVLEVDQREAVTPAVIDGPTAEGMDVPQFLPADARVVLVVREGTSARALEAAAAQFLPGELFGALFVPAAARGARVVVGTTPGSRPLPGEHAGSVPSHAEDVTAAASGSDRTDGADLAAPFAQVRDASRSLDRRDHTPTAEGEPSVFSAPVEPNLDDGLDARVSDAQASDAHAPDAPTPDAPGTPDLSASDERPARTRDGPRR